jgi:hypothetical protein
MYPRPAFNEILSQSKHTILANQRAPYRENIILIQTLRFAPLFDENLDLWWIFDTQSHLHLCGSKYKNDESLLTSFFRLDAGGGGQTDT